MVGVFLFFFLVMNKMALKKSHDASKVQESVLALNSLNRTLKNQNKSESSWPSFIAGLENADICILQDEHCQLRIQLFGTLQQLTGRLFKEQQYHSRMQTESNTQTFVKLSIQKITFKKSHNMLPIQHAIAWASLHRSPDHSEKTEQFSRFIAIHIHPLMLSACSQLQSDIMPFVRAGQNPC